MQYIDIYEIFKDIRRNKNMKFKKIAAISTAVMIACTSLVGCNSKTSEEDSKFK